MSGYCAVTGSQQKSRRHLPPWRCFCRLAPQGSDCGKWFFRNWKTWTATNPLLVEVVSWLVQRTVDQHLRIAWSRMFSDVNKDVAILLCDGDLWKHRGRNYSGGRMASRISEAIAWLEQLLLLDSSGLTSKGEAVLKHGYDVLTRHGGDV